jgi:hypothetical protein
VRGLRGRDGAGSARLEVRPESRGEDDEGRFDVALLDAADASLAALRALMGLVAALRRLGPGARVAVRRLAQRLERSAESCGVALPEGTLGVARPLVGRDASTERIWCS